MLIRPLGTTLLLSLVLQGLTAQAGPDPRRDPPWQERHDRRDDHRGDRRDDRRDDRRGDDREHRDDRREGRRFQAYRYEDRRHPGRYLAPPWMAGYWRPHERRYVALIPGDPSRCYVFMDGRWLLRRIEDPQARLDIEGAFSLPMAPPPMPPPHLGLGINLHVVLFN